MRIVAAALALALTGCGSDTPADRLSNREASEIVRQINQGPIVLIQPEPILESELTKLDFRSGGCVFSPGDGARGAMALAMEEAGYMKFGGKLVRFAADSGSGKLQQGARRRYVGTGHLFMLDMQEEGRGRLTVEDAGRRAVYEQEGMVWCDPLEEPSAAP